MENDQARFFGDETAAVYDATDRRRDTDAVVEVLAGLAGGGPALELAIGTGRVALPLADRGIRVDGVDISAAMIDQLRAKPGGDSLDVAIGDMAEVPVPDTYRLAYVVANSICNLGTQDSQVRCFENVAAHLDPGGAFVVEGFVPDPDWIRKGQYVEAEAVDAGRVVLDVCRLDPVAQTLEENHVVLTGAGVTLHPVLTRYIWPSELDLMARLAGLHLEARWAGWDRAPFTAASRAYVALYRR